MAVYKIFPSKDATLYSMFPQMNTGLDEIIESTQTQIATENNIPLYKVFVFNDLKETDLLAQDQLLFLANKKVEADKSFHLVVTGERLYDISQKEGIQLKKLKEYNPSISDNPAVGTQLILVKPKEQKSKLSLKK
jgi:LysM repeat protein